MTNSAQITNGVQEKWLPPSPHREKLLETLARGRAHIEDQGHGKPPLLVYEDGGAMEVPCYRWIDDRAVAVDAVETASTTRFLDVCGSVDELKRLLSEQKEEPASRQQVLQLLHDALGMISRMERRIQQYQQFRTNAQEILDRMEQRKGPDCQQAVTSAEAIRTALEAPTLDEEAICNLAEQVRDVAQRLENDLYPLRDCCVEMFKLYEEVRGARHWRTG